MTITITVANQKGGVGKTTSAVNLAHGLVLAGKRVLLVDLDPQGQISTALGLKSEPGAFNLLVADLPPSQVIRLTDRTGLYVILGDKKTATAQTVLSIQRAPISFTHDRLVIPANAEDIDYVVIDTSPSVGELQEQALWAAKQVLIPCAVDYLASDGVISIIATLEKIRTDYHWAGKVIGIIPTFFDDVTRETKATITDLSRQFGKLLLTPVHRATILRECAVEGKTIFEHGPHSRAAREYQALVDYVLSA